MCAHSEYNCNPSYGRADVYFACGLQRSSIISTIMFMQEMNSWSMILESTYTHIYSMFYFSVSLCEAA